MTGWVAIALDGGLWRGYLLSGDQVVKQVEGPDRAALIAQIGAGNTIVQIGEGAAHCLPTGILPSAGTSVPPLVQNAPPDVISALVRIWVAGVLSVREHWDGVICAMQGDVTHWLHVSANEVVSAQSFLTPRLRTVMKGAQAASETALGDTISRPERLAAHLRQAEVAGDFSAISGHLLGAELAAAKPYWLGQQVVLVSNEPEAHLSALKAQGTDVSAVDPASALEVGLGALGRAWGFATQ